MKEFKECKECSKKAGSPILCESCLHNRSLINALTDSTKGTKAWAIVDENKEIVIFRQQIQIYHEKEMALPALEFFKEKNRTGWFERKFKIIQVTIH